MILLYTIIAFMYNAALCVLVLFTLATGKKHMGEQHALAYTFLSKVV